MYSQGVNDALPGTCVGESSYDTSIPDLKPRKSVPQNYKQTLHMFIKS